MKRRIILKYLVPDISFAALHSHAERGNEDDSGLVAAAFRLRLKAHDLKVVATVASGGFAR
jgi:hypothetical protein